MNNKIRITIVLSAAMTVILSVLTITSLTKASEPLNANTPPEGYIPIPTIEKYGNTEALLIQNKDVWGRNSNEIALQEAGISYDLIHSNNLASIDLNKYKFIMYSSDQTQEYYHNIEANIDKIEDFVKNGGLLIAHVCDQSWTPANWSGMHILPGDVQHATGIYLQDLTIMDTTHQIVRGTPIGNFDIFFTNPNYFDGWGWSTHGYLTNLPDKTITVIKIGSGSYENQPTYIDYNFGKGKVLATMQTVEWGYFSGSQWWVGNRPELLRNELRLAKRIFPTEAEKLAKDVIGKDYKLEWGNSFTKGVRNRQFVGSSTIEYLDCAGLSFWSYNRGYYGDKKLLFHLPKDVKNLWDYDEYENRPLYYEGANMQYRGNTDRELELTEEDLKPGDLLFFDWEKDGKIDHVEMYVDDFYYQGGWIGESEERQYYPSGIYNLVAARGDEIHNYGIVPDRLNTRIKVKGFVGFGRVIDAKVALKIIGNSPIDLIITTPDGEIITKEMGESLTMGYMIYDIDGDGELEDVVAMPERKIGDYLIQVVPEPDALPTDTYTLEVTVNGQTIVLAENVPISEIPRTPYIIRSTETEIIPIIPAFVDFDPNTLNLKSNGKFVTVYLELPQGYDINEINLGSIKLNNQIPIEPKPTEIGDYDKNGIPDLMIKFNRSAVQNVLEIGDEVKITISGNLIDERPFEGSDTIRVISKGK